jgi:hypothetical protein
MFKFFGFQFSFSLSNIGGGGGSGSIAREYQTKAAAAEHYSYNSFIWNSYTGVNIYIYVCVYECE